MGRLAVSRIALATVCSVILLISVAARAQEVWIFVGFYKLGEAFDLGEDIDATVTVRIRNDSDADVSGATVTLADPFLPAVTYGSFDPFSAITISAGESVRLTGSFIVPRREYENWQEGIAPRLRIEFEDANGDTAQGPVALAPTPIPED